MVTMGGFGRQALKFFSLFLTVFLPYRRGARPPNLVLRTILPGVTRGLLEEVGQGGCL